MQSLGQAFGTPGPRSDLSLSGSLGQGTSINLGNEFEAHLRQLYRKTFEKLDREGRVDEAVFVLAELLQARQEALDYLEKHQRHAQAAELALAWDWPPAVIVRLLCLSGDWRRALAVARRDNAFASAVLQMHDRWPDAANRLREEWGQALAQQGEWLKAVDAVWPVAALQACAARLQSLRDDPLLHGERAALAAALNAATGHTEASRGLVAVLMPALLADQSQGRGRFDKKTMQSLMRLNPDTLLQADLPGGELPGTEARPLLKQPALLSVEAPTAGSHPALDAVLLDEGRYLVATGEAGALMTDATGRVLARFAVPAYRLVVAHSGQLALALAQRDGLWRVSRIDLVQRQVSDLGLSEIDHFAGEFDGIGWTVARGRRVQVIDTGRSLRDVLWQVNRRGDRAVGHARDGAVHRRRRYAWAEPLALPVPAAAPVEPRAADRLAGCHVAANAASAPDAAEPERRTAGRRQLRVALAGPGRNDRPPSFRHHRCRPRAGVDRQRLDGAAPVRCELRRVLAPVARRQPRRQGFLARRGTGASTRGARRLAVVRRPGPRAAPRHRAQHGGGLRHPLSRQAATSRASAAESRRPARRRCS